MQAGDVKLGAVFANDHQNVIPIFQRPYVWDQEANWLPLWKDIRTAAEEFEAEQHSPSSQEDPRTYFLGAVVLQQRRRPPRRLASSHIIDGQQRLTTLQVLLAAARSVAHTNACLTTSVEPQTRAAPGLSSGLIRHCAAAFATRSTDSAAAGQNTPSPS
ncbi:hypothetical protein SMICM304S_02816 [Streptomyces microflavus]